MSLKKWAEFDTWYEERLHDSNYVFTFQHELKECWLSEVKLLKAGCLRFREFTHIAHFIPF